jgi:hypothetical protein
VAVGRMLERTHRLRDFVLLTRSRMMSPMKWVATSPLCRRPLPSKHWAGVPRVECWRVLAADLSHTHPLAVAFVDAQYA